MFLERQCVLVVQFNSLFSMLEVTKPQPVKKAEEPTKKVAEEEKTITEKISPETGRGI